jgi:hypothetical protein
VVIRVLFYRYHNEKKAIVVGNLALVTVKFQKQKKSTIVHSGAQCVSVTVHRPNDTLNPTSPEAEAARITHAPRAACPAT